jgi:hypothetical protein
MRTNQSDTPTILHALPGRVRLHLPGLPGTHWDRIISRLQDTPWVKRAQLNRLTGNLLVRFEAREDEASAQMVLALVEAEWPLRLKLFSADPDSGPLAKRTIAPPRTSFRTALPVLLSAAEVLLGRKGWLVNAVTAVAPATFRWGLGSLCERQVAQRFGIAAELTIAVLSGGFLSLAVASLSAVLRTFGSRPTPALPRSAVALPLRASAA